MGVKNKGALSVGLENLFIYILLFIQRAPIITELSVETEPASSPIGCSMGEREANLMVERPSAALCRSTFDVALAPAWIVF